MKRRVHIVRLVVALISVINATSALAASKTLVWPCSSAPPVIEANHLGLPVRVQRPPRVPRREQYW